MTDLRKAAEMAFDLLCDAVEPTATQVQADIGMCAQWDVDAIECIEILRQALAQPEQKLIGWKDGEPQYIEQPEQEKLCVVCGKPTMHMGNKCYGCCQTAQPEQEPVAWQVMVENEPMKEFSVKDMAHDWAITEKRNGSKYSYWIRPLYAAPISEPVKERISEPVENLEPVAWMLPDYGDVLSASEADGTGIYNIPLYTAPPKPEQWTPVEIGVDVTPDGAHVVGMYVLMPEAVRHVFYSRFYPAPKRKWVGLTNEEVDAIRNNIFEKYKKALLVTRDVTSKNDYSAFNFYQAIEKKLRSKNDI